MISPDVFWDFLTVKVIKYLEIFYYILVGYFHI